MSDKKYPNMNDTHAGEVIIIQESVEMCPVGKYRNFPVKDNGMVDVLVGELPKNSAKRVLVQCPVCKMTRSMIFSHISRFNHTICNPCARTIDLTGVKFGRWTVISCYHPESRGGGSRWLCRCSCGTERDVSASGLMSGQSTSCGCINIENLKSKVGSLNKSWSGGKVEVYCEQCGNKYRVNKHRLKRTRFCSRKCITDWQSVNQSGENNHNWNFDLTKKQRTIKRKTAENYQWIRDVLGRDDYTCQICGKVGGRLEVHHKYNYKTYPEYAYEIWNGLTMCREDHLAFHSWNGGLRESCIPADIDRWLYETSCTIGD